MKNEFIPYEQALELKELGYNELCGAFYEKDLGSIYQHYAGFDIRNDDVYYNDYKLECTAPTYSQAFRWFREKKIFGAVVPIDDWDYWGITVLEQDCMAPFYVSYMSDMDYKEYQTYEEAELACLKKLIETVKNK